MRVLLTGASSFSGHWFLSALAAAGHEVTATYRGDAGTYDGVRAMRVELGARLGRQVFRCAFGDDRFRELLEDGDAFDVLCHHGATVGDYRSADFDEVAALESNTRGARALLRALAGRGGVAIVATGSMFEAGEGAGSDGLRTFSAYGLSKALTAQVLAYEATQAGLAFGKFVIPTPFGPYEEGRFTSFLAGAWLRGERPTVKTPLYVRDSIHVSLLARAYARFVDDVVAARASRQINPSGYVETVGAFAQRMARELEQRLGVACEVALGEQTDFSEPRVRLNTDALDGRQLGWSEAAAWDELGRYYRDAFRP